MRPAAVAVVLLLGMGSPAAGGADDHVQLVGTVRDAWGCDGDSPIVMDIVRDPVLGWYSAAFTIAGGCFLIQTATLGWGAPLAVGLDGSWETGFEGYALHALCGYYVIIGPYQGGRAIDVQVWAAGYPIEACYDALWFGTVDDAALA